MSFRRRVYRSDGNASALDERARAHGVSIWRGERPLDRIWGLAGITALAEYKNPETSYGRAGLSKGQAQFAASWRGGRPFVISTVEDVDRAVAEMRRLGRLLTRPASGAA